MKVVFKYDCSIDDEVSVMMPADAKILKVAVQRSNDDDMKRRCFCIWALVETDNLKTDRHFRVYGTGKPIENEKQKFIETFLDEPFVWHLFEEV